MEKLEEIGTVTGLREVTPYTFWVRMRPAFASGIRLEAIVRVDFSWGEETFRLYGVVNEVVASWDGTVTTGYQEEACAEGRYSGVTIYLGQVVVTRTLKKEGESFVTVPPLVPPPVGEKVFLAPPEETDVALGFDEVKRARRALPCGVLSNNEVAYLDVRYLLGDNGAHVNVSGQSGVAAKTSYATFLLWMMLNYPRAPECFLSGDVATFLRDSRAIVFNVKGESLLFLDHWNSEWEEAKGSREAQLWEDMFRRFGVNAQPFEGVTVAVPPRKDGRPDIRHSRDRVSAYGWDILDIAELHLLPLFFDPEELEEKANFALAVSVIEEFLYDQYTRLVEEARAELFSRDTPYLEENIRFSCEGLDDRTLVRLYLAVCGQDPKWMLRRFGLPNSLKDLIELLHGYTEEGEKGAGALAAALGSEKVEDKTVLAISRRLRLAERSGLDRLWRSILPSRTVVFHHPPVPEYTLPWNRPAGVTVVDIAKLSSRGQAFVVGAVLREILWAKEQDLLKEPVFIYLDELNKYAPREGGGPLGQIFRDVAERGRSFRIVLIGAEQTASQVDYRVVTQAATTVVGRQKHAELSKEEYAHLQGILREKAAALLPGEVIVDQPFFRLPLTVRFPLTPWATSEEKRLLRYGEGVVSLSKEEFRKLFE
uniref:ATP-binding protein n=1 Tax=Candidatus Caldatribacterium californiense TaxID=1454726 RepID=A0A7V3YL34_9BACT